MEQTVTFDSGGLTLTGIVHPPDDLEDRSTRQFL